MKDSDLYETPPEIFRYASDKYGPFDLDACALRDTRKTKAYMGPDHDAPEGRDALSANWSDYEPTATWMNPPYSNPKPWVEKALMEAKHGVKTVALLPADTSTKWFHLILNADCHIEYLPKRVRFLFKGKRCGSPKFGNVLVVFFPQVPFP